MKEVTVHLKTGGHCIQSAAKSELRRISLVILYSPDDNAPPVLTEQFKLLEGFIENTDFNKLRASDERYTGITDAICILSRDRDGNPVIKTGD
jgi:hypothetical protein